MNTIGFICTIIGAVAAILGGVWWIIDRVTKSGVKEYRLSLTENAIKGLPCKEHSKTISDHNRNIYELKNLTKENNNMLTELSKWAMKMDEGMIDTLAKKASPLKMTEAGKYLYEKSEADKTLSELAPTLLKKIEDAAPRTEYDIEQNALNALLSCLGDKEFDTIKKFVYYSPDKIKVETTGEEIKFDLYSIVRLMSIELRDLYLSTHEIGQVEQSKKSDD